MGGPVQAGEVAIEDLEALRVPLAGYCYRLLGSAVDTDDAVQETLIRASSRRDQYDPGRGRLSARRPDPVAIGDPEDAGHRDLLRRYVTAFEAHDIEGLKAVLRADAVASMPPFAWRLAGAEAIAEAVGASEYCAGARLVRCRMNGAWGFGQYRPGDDDVLRPFALVAVEISGGTISRLVTFLGTQERFGEFGLPDSL
jgi:hypothetical protein